MGGVSRLEMPDCANQFSPVTPFQSAVLHNAPPFSPYLCMGVSRDPTARPGLQLFNVKPYISVVWLMLLDTTYRIDTAVLCVSPGLQLFDDESEDDFFDDEDDDDVYVDYDCTCHPSCHADDQLREAKFTRPRPRNGETSLL